LTLTATSDSASASRTEEAFLQVTVEPERGAHLKKKVTAQEIQENEEYKGPETVERGMIVSRLAVLLGVEVEDVTSVVVEQAEDHETHELLPPLVTDGEEVGGFRFFPGFGVEEAGQQIRFFWPPSFVGQAPQNRSIVSGFNQHALLVTFNVAKGVLSVSLPVPAFTPAAPEAGTPVTFASPILSYKGKPVFAPHYSWKIGSTQISDQAAPTYPFEPKVPKGAKGVDEIHVVLAVKAKTAGGEEVTGTAPVTVPVTLKEPGTPGGPGPPGHGHEPAGGGGPKLPKVPGAPGGPANNPASGVLPSKESQPSTSVSLSLGNGAGAEGRGSGRGRNGSAKAGNGSGHTRKAAGTGGNARTTAARVAAKTPLSSPPIASETPVASGPPKRAENAHPGPRVGIHGLIGVLLEQEAPTVEPGFARQFEESQQTTAPSFPDAGRGKGSAGGPMTFLGWVAGSFLVLTLVLAGGVKEFQPRARYRRLSAG
jgi:hypothetical protein